VDIEIEKFEITEKTEDFDLKIDKETIKQTKNKQKSSFD